MGFFIFIIIILLVIIILSASSNKSEVWDLSEKDDYGNKVKKDYKSGLKTIELDVPNPNIVEPKVFMIIKICAMAQWPKSISVALLKMCVR